jgi:hypothetical protein
VGKSDPTEIHSAVKSKRSASAVVIFFNAHLDDSPSAGSDDTNQECSEPELEASAL